MIAPELFETNTGNTASKYHMPRALPLITNGEKIVELDLGDSMTILPSSEIAGRGDTAGAFMNTRKPRHRATKAAKRNKNGFMEKV